MQHGGLPDNALLSLDACLRGKVDAAAFDALRAELAAARARIDEYIKTHHELDADPEAGLDVDHHDEYVLGQLGILDTKVDGIGDRVAALEARAQAADGREAKLLLRIAALEQQSRAAEQHVAQIEVSVDRLSTEEAKILRRLSQHDSQLDALAAAAAEARDAPPPPPPPPPKPDPPAVVVEPYDDTALREELARVSSTAEAALRSGLHKVQRDLDAVYTWCRRSAQIHATNIKRECASAVALRDDVLTRTGALGQLLDQILGEPHQTQPQPQKQSGASSRKGRRHNPKSRPHGRRRTTGAGGINGTRIGGGNNARAASSSPSASNRATDVNPQLQLQQIGTVASALRSVLVPRLAEFRSAADRIAASTSLELANHALRRRADAAEEDPEEDPSGEDEDTENDALRAAAAVAGTVTASRDDVDAAVEALSQRISAAWDRAHAAAMAAVATASSAAVVPALAPSPSITVPPPSRGVGLDDVRAAVDAALGELRLAMREKASKIMVSVVQEQSLAQIDV